jgi:hypothetical protein
MIKKIQILIALIMMVNYINAQVDVTATLGATTGSYPTLADAFSKVNDGTHKGSIVITLTANTTETVTSNLDSSGNTTGSSYSSITIKPQAATAVTISGAVAGPLITLNGADNVTIDGLNVGGASLNIFNSDATTSSTIRLVNDASNNKILNATIKGAGASSTLGVVHFSTGLSTGNDGNKIANCNIDATGNAYNCIYSSGSSTTPELQNSNDTVQNCRIYDFFNTNASSLLGIYLSAGNTNWYIFSNSIYQTTSRSTATQTLIYGMLITPNWTTDAHVVKNNFVGGTAPNATNTFTFSGSGANVVGFQGINVQTGGVGGLVEGNVVKNITCTYSSANGSFTNTGYSAFIGGFDGVTTFNNNIIDSFSVTNNGGSCAGVGIVVNGRVTAASTIVKPVFNVTNNTISNLTFNTSGTNSTTYYGIRLDVSSSASLTNNATSNPNFVVTGNTITNLNCTNGGTSGICRGIGVLSSQGTSATAVFWPKGNISNNIITGISMNSNAASITSATAVGINFLGFTTTAYTTDSTIISGNTISDIKATNAGEFSSLVAGIYVTNGLYGITRNRIFNLSNASPGTTSTPWVVGINSRGISGTGTTGSTYIANNFISLGKSNTGVSYSTNTYYYGILNNFSTSRIHNIYYNTVILDGNVTSGAYKSACYHRGSETFGTTANSSNTDLKNNIFINLRNGGTGEHYAISAGAGTNAISSNYNNVYAANANTVGYWNGAAQTFASFQTSSGGDANSKSVSVNFVNTSTGDLHLTGASNGDVNLRGITISGFSTDFDGQSRGTNPYMGADEASISLPLQLLTFNGQVKSNNAVLSWSTVYETNSAFFNIEKSTDAVYWNTVGSITAKGSNSKNDYSFIDNNLSGIKTYYRLKIVDQDGKYVYSPIIILELNGKLLFVLQQNYPNPVKNSTTLRYQLDKTSVVFLEVFSIDGKLVTKVQNGRQDAGLYNMQFNVLQHHLTPGKYIYKLTAINTTTGELATMSKEMTVIQ